MYVPSKLFAFRFSLTISVLQNEKAQSRSYQKLRPWAVSQSWIVRTNRPPGPPGTIDAAQVIGSD